MNNLELLKEELVNQKNILEDKGITVTTIHVNPSPSEITTAINAIEIPDLTDGNATIADVKSGKTFFAGNSTLKTGSYEEPNFSNATALVSDVAFGKTFYAGNNDLKTGTLDNSANYQNYYKVMVGGEFVGSLTNIIPSGITRIRQYCFYDMASALEGHIDIPEGIVTIERYSFFHTDISSYTLPSTIRALDVSAFQSCSLLTSLVIPDQVTTIGSGLFQYDKNATSVYIGTGISLLSTNCMPELTYITSINIPANIVTINNGNFQKCPELTDLYINGDAVNCLSTQLLNIHNTNLKVWVNFEDLPYYYQATNWVRIQDHLISKVTLSANNNFPTFTSSSLTVNWYTTIEDAMAGINSVTNVSCDGDYYCKVI